MLQIVVEQNVLKYKAQKWFKGKNKKGKTGTELAHKTYTAFLWVETKAESAFGSASFGLPFRFFELRALDSFLFFSI